MKEKLRKCEACGVEELTASRSKICLTCYCQQKSELNKQEDRILLESIYDDVMFEGRDKHGKALWSFVHSACGTRQTWMIGNVKKQLKLRPDKEPCTKCGGKERMASAFAGYLEKYGRTFDFDVDDWEKYRQRVRGLTEVTYKEHKFTINPLNLKRGVRTYHLDHRVPIIECYLRGWSPELASAVDNLQMLRADANLTKGRKIGPTCNVPTIASSE